MKAAYGPSFSPAKMILTQSSSSTRALLLSARIWKVSLVFLVLCLTVFWYTVWHQSSYVVPLTTIGVTMIPQVTTPASEPTPTDNVAVDTSLVEPPTPIPKPDSLLDFDKLGVIIESQVTPNLIPLMLHFSSVLGPSWPIVLFTLEESWTAPDSVAFARAVTSGKIHVRFLPPNTVMTNSLAVSRFLTAPWLWEQLRLARRVLLFQTDSVICSNANTTVDDFFEYDFIGAPIERKYGAGYNGGLSLRNPQLFLQIARERTFNASFEDQWFYEQIGSVGGHMPPPEVAKLFSVETSYYERPLGYHQPQRWQKTKMGQIKEYCPEVSMLSSRRAT